MRNHLPYLTPLLVLFLASALYAQDTVPLKLLGLELPIDRDWLPWLLALVALLALVRYGPEAVDRIRDSMGSVKQQKMALELERLALENLKLQHELKVLGETPSGPLSETVGESGSMSEPVGTVMEPPRSRRAAERLASRTEMIRTQINHPDRRKAFMWSRVLAFLIDFILVSVVIVSFIEEDWSGIIVLLYFWIMWATREATVGMMVLGLRIVRLDAHEVTALDALKRLSVWLALPCIPFLWTPFDKNKQSLHDKWPKTLVVKERGSLESRKLIFDVEDRA